jgi:transposase InsO family protein
VALEAISDEKTLQKLSVEYGRFDTIKELRRGLKDYFGYYNNRRKHQSLGYRTLSEVYGGITNTHTA